LSDELKSRRTVDVRDEIKLLIAEVRLMRQQLTEMRTHMGSALQFNDDSLRDLGRRIDRLSEVMK
jgi:hypothetical protein